MGGIAVFLAWIVIAIAVTVIVLMAIAGWIDSQDRTR